MCKAEWMDIETAPKDGCSIIIATKGHPIRTGHGTQNCPPVCEAHWHDGWYNERVSGWMLANCDEEYGILMEATHWMPLPAPPKQEDK